ncbi:MAG: choice-of-anchor Q domain-containing protein, partial [Bacteroidota bacterium]
MKKNHHLIWDNLSRIISVFKKSSINNRHFYGIGLMGMLILSLFSYKAEQSKQALVDRIIYVDQNALGSDNGTTWANAYLTLTEALADARSTNDEVEIWVADGIYFPDEGTNIVDADGNASAANNSNATFLVDRDGINIYGGFMGGEGSRMFIDPSTNLTILSGDIDANDTKNGDGITEAVSDQSGTNAKTILTIKDISSPSLSNTLEGLVFTAATETAVVINEETNAESITVNLSENSFIGNEGEMGGAVQIISSTGASVNTTISNSTFKSNNADNGGAIYVETNSAASMITLTDLELESNSSSNTGGALYYLADDANASSLNLTRVDFKTNEASDNGGAFYFENDGGEVDVDIMDSDFTENESTDDGGAIYLYNFDDDNTDTDFTLEEVNFTTNMSGAGGGAIFTNADGGEKLSFGLTTVTFEGNFTDDSEGGAIYFDLAGMNLNPTFEDVLFKNNTGSEGGAIYIDFDSQTFGGSFSNVTFDGNTGETGGAIYLDGDAGNFTTNVSNTVFTGNSSENEGGALYFESESGGTATASFTDVEFNGNKTLDGEGGAIYFNIEGGSNQSTFTNVLFNRNKAKDDSDADETIGNGGALYINADGGDAGMVFENCIFDSNKSEHVTYDDGDADKQPAFINSTFYGASNSAIYIEAFDSGQTPIDFTNCIFWNNNQDVVSFNNSKVNVGSDGELVNINFSITEEATNFFSPGQNNLFENPLFVDAPNGDFNLQQLSPAIDEGDDSALNTASDFDGNDRVLGCAVDMGALESLFKTVFAGEDKTVCACEFIQLEGTRAGDAMTVIWSGGDGEFDDPTDPQTLYYPTESELNSGTITLRLTSTKPGCTNLFDEVTFTIDDLVDIDKECDGTFDISWLQIDGDNPLDVVEWNVAIRDNDVFLKQYNNLTSPEILVTEGTLVPGAEYFIQIEEVYSNGAVSTTCILPPVDNA